MNPIQKLTANAKQMLTASVRLGMKAMGSDLLGKRQTNRFLTPFDAGIMPGNSVTLPTVVDVIDSQKPIFPPTIASTASTQVWHYKGGTDPTYQLPCGLVRIGQRVLNTDYWTRDALKDVFGRDKRQTQRVKTLIAPFGHYFDGDVFVGYYDFMFLVAAKLCRMKALLPESVFANAVVAYPLMHTAFEQEVLTLLGFSPDRVFDSRQHAFQFEECVIGSHENWAYQTLGDIRALKDQIESRLPMERTAENRVYISRAVRRRVLNEDALVRLLEQYDFQIIEDKPRTVAEQRAIYQNASFILGPHGASFTNILWCEPGTHLMELFSPNFVTDCFRYLAHVQGLSYSAYANGPIRQPLDGRFIGDDITVSISDLERHLDAVFTAQTTP